MRRLIVVPILSAIVGAGCALAPAAVPSTPAPVPPVKPACEPGEVVVYGDDATPCDLIGGANTLTVLDISEYDCAHIGGRWEYEACVDADF